MFKPKQLPHKYDDYAPVISTEIMQLHYEKHYCGYINNLNKALEKYPDFFKLEIPQVLRNLNDVPEDVRTVVRNNGGGSSNHEIFWEILSTQETKIEDGPLKKAVCNVFGTWESFIEKFKDMSYKLFGSGWVWLTINDNSRELSIVTTENQDSPYMFGLYPVMGLDVWEHSYYLQYKNVRKEYVDNVMKIINWKEVEKRYLAIN